MSEKKVAVYPGSFNPFHIGHYDVLLQAIELFDTIYVAVGASNVNKGQLPVTDRVTRVSNQLSDYSSYFKSNVEVHGYDLLLTEYMMRLQTAVKVNHIIRGLRSGHDLDYEANLRKFVHDINPEIQFVYFLPRTSNLYHISSSMIREIAKYDIKLAKKYVFNPDKVRDEDIIS